MITGIQPSRGAISREFVPSISLRDLRKQNWLTPGALIALRWYQAEDQVLVMQGREVTITDKGLEKSEPWDDREHLAAAHLFVRDECVEILVKFNGKSHTDRVFWKFNRAGYGDVKHFACPACWRACDFVYLTSAARGRAACRKCCRLTYRSQYSNRYDRAEQKSNVIKRRLGDVFMETGYFPEKPKWMRWPTYRRLIDKAEQYDLESMARWHKWYLLANRVRF